MTPPFPVLLLDTSAVITIMEEAERPDIIGVLAENSQRLEIPRRVIRELETPKTRSLLRSIENIEFLGLQDDELVSRLRGRYPSLANGELGVLARARSLDGREEYVSVLDDGKARDAAELEGLELTGTIGLLRELEKLELLSRDDHKKMLIRMKACEFRYDWDDPNLPIHD